MCCCRFAICVKEGIAYGEKFILKGQNRIENKNCYFHCIVTINLFSNFILHLAYYMRPDVVVAVAFIVLGIVLDFFKFNIRREDRF